ncbi:hypothetical protein ACKTEK_02445 [Tepidamorphus sp. 3E244]|uniref:hypothetical protein n=1 Tax=Tepidamorphus sp. 3E244 TaxID=3385498 RepID=UPI0038FC7C4C
MAEFQQPEDPRQNEALESKFHEVGISAVTAAASYCPSLKAKSARRTYNPQFSSVMDTD